ncbi:MAG: class I SAM-dependent methyltransferase [Ruminococcus sp.]|nr:class I SAM-dependent methyltransferase [Ruminococcus sp.]
MKYHKLVENAGRPQGFWGKMMIKSMNKGHSELTDWALVHLEIKRNYNALDIGCGGGKTVSKLCKRIGNGKVFGIDYSELCVEKSKKLNKNNIMCGKASILQSSVSSLPFEDNKFDVITAVETYYFWPDKLNDLKEVYRVLKSGGKLLLVFEMVKSEEELHKWDKVEKSLGIEAVSKDGIADILLHAGYQNIRTYSKSSTGWLCVTAEKE